MEQRPRILPPVYLLFTLLVMIGLHFQWPMAHYLAPPLSWAGAGLLALGLWVSGTSARAFGKAETGIIPFDEATSLVTDGFYRYTRNPMYLGMVLSVLGVSMMLGTVGSLLPIPVFTLILHRRFILREESFMEAAFGEAYRQYKGRVRRWI